MIAFLPYILLLIAWDRAQPGETMVLDHALHASEQQCETAGRAFLAEKAAPSSAPAEKGYRYFCIPAPSAEAYERAFEQRP